MKIRILYILITILIVACPEPIMAQSRGSQAVKKEQRDANKRLNDTRRQVSANKKELTAQLNQLNAINAQIELITRQIAAGEAEALRLEMAIAAVNDTIKQLEDEIARLKESAKQSLRDARKQRQSMTSTNLIFSAGSFTTAAKRIGYLKQLDRSRDKKARNLREAEIALNTKRQELARLVDNQRHLLAQLTTKRNQLELSQKEMQQLVAALRRQGHQLDTELRERRDLVATLDRELEQAIAEEERIRAEEEARRIAEEQARLRAEEEARLRAEEEARKQAEEEARKQAEAAASQQVAQAAPAQSAQPAQQSGGKGKGSRKPSKNKGGSTAPTVTQPAAPAAPAAPSTAPSAPVQQPSTTAAAPKLSGSFANNKGKLPYPVSGKFTVVGTFGRNRHANFSRVEVENPGIDIQVAPGTQAKAVFDGSVSSIFQLGGYHNIVMVRHGEYLTVYANIDQLSVRKGDTVKAGQALGIVYTDPDDDNRAVLHFEVRKEREKQNPIEWLKPL